MTRHYTLEEMIVLLQKELEDLGFLSEPWATSVERNKGYYATWTWPRFAGWILFRMDVATSKEVLAEVIVTFLKVLAPETVSHIRTWKEDPVMIDLREVL